MVVELLERPVIPGGRKYYYVIYMFIYPPPTPTPGGLLGSGGPSLRSGLQPDALRQQQPGCPQPADPPGSVLPAQPALR